MSAPFTIPADAVALFRLPLSLIRLSEICAMYADQGADISQIGDWVVVLKRKEGQP